MRNGSSDLRVLSVLSSKPFWYRFSPRRGFCRVPRVSTVVSELRFSAATGDWVPSQGSSVQSSGGCEAHWTTGTFDGGHGTLKGDHSFRRRRYPRVYVGCVWGFGPSHGPRGLR